MDDGVVLDHDDDNRTDTEKMIISFLLIDMHDACAHWLTRCNHN